MNRLLRLLSAAVGLIGCTALDSAYTCSATSQCFSATQQGVCESTGRCSFRDELCTVRSRYGMHAGDRSGQCVCPITRADVDPNGTINLFDSLALGAYAGLQVEPAGAAPARYDQDQNGSIDDQDKNLIAGQFGKTTSECP